MVTLHELVVKILRTYNYEIRQTDRSFILAHKDGNYVAVGVMLEDLPISLDDINNFLNKIDALKNIQFVAKIFISLQKPTREALELVSRNNIIIWDKEKLRDEIGRATLIELGGVTLKEDFITKPEELEISSISGTKQPFPELSIEIEKLRSQRPELIIKPRINLEDATEIARHTIRGFRYELELIPYYMFEYSCDLVVEGRETTEQKRGILGINGLTGNYEQWQKNFETVGEIQSSHTKLEPKIDDEKAYRLAQESAIELNTTEIETVRDKGTVTIIEKRKVRPKDGAINLKKRGLIYLPVWCVEGSNGVMIINAATGKIIREDFYSGPNKF